MKKEIEYLIERCESKGPFDQVGWRRRYCRIGRYWIAANMEVLHYHYYILQGIEEAKQLMEWDSANVHLRLLFIQLSLDGNHFEQVEELLQGMEKYKKNFSVEIPQVNGIVFYFRCLLSFYRGKTFQVKRYWKRLEQELQQSSGDPLLLCLYARVLRVIQEDWEKSMEMLYKAYEQKCRSPLFYLELNMVMMANPSVLNQMDSFKLQGIRWGMRYGFITKEVVEKFCFWVLQQPKIHYEGYGNWERGLYLWYQETHSQPILHALCKIYIEKGKTDIQALEIYKKAWEEQIYIHQIEKFYIKAAYDAKEEEIPLSILQGQLIEGDLSVEHQAFLYHMLIKNQEQDVFLWEEDAKKFSEFAKECLAQRRKGIYYGTLYQKLIDDHMISKEELSLLWEFLFLYEIQIPLSEVEMVFIQNSDEEKGHLIPVKKEKILISMANPPSTLLCLKNSGTLLPPQAKIIKIIPHVPDFLLQWYVDNGYDSLPLRITVARRYMEKGFLTPKEIAFLEETLYIDGMAKDFRYKLNEWLAFYYAKKKEYEKAQGYYSQLSFEKLPLEVLREGIKTLIYTQQGKEALFWLSTMGVHWLEQKELMDLVNISIQQKLLTSYGLYLLQWVVSQGFMKKQWSDDFQVSFLGTLEQILDMRERFHQLEIKTGILEKRILQQSIWTKRWHPKVEEVFIQRYQKDPEDVLHGAFASYCTYRILRGEGSLSFATVQILEDVFLQDPSQHSLGYALLYLYGEKQMHTPQREKILDCIFPLLLQKKIHFPWLHKIKDKNQYTSYIERNVSFLCIASPKKKVWFCYKNQETKEYESKPMTYVGMGLYTVKIPVFYNEKIEYYMGYSAKEEGSLKKGTYHHTEISLTKDLEDVYHMINNGLLYYSLFQFDEAEKAIEQGLAFYEEDKKGILL
ncbi:MAG: hypothetical protein GX238_02870 [Epulopiscium sp.]|nr:hypothetical protein [Candidatus Epulonipiscium sp.]